MKKNLTELVFILDRSGSMLELIRSGMLQKPDEQEKQQDEHAA